MNTNKLKLALILICAVLIVPATSEASAAIQINDHTVLFTIDFTFSDEQFENEVPIAAKYGVSYFDRVDTVGYTIEGSDYGDVAISEINALVLSTSPITGTRYSVPKETEVKFQIFILATFSESLTGSYKARITKLPYFIESRRTTVHQNQLDELDVPVLEISK